MTTAQTLRQAAAVLLAEADRQEGKITNPQQMTTFAGRSVTVQEAWELLLAEIVERAKPHAWIDWLPGTAPWDVGDNDPPDEDFLRKFKPFMDAATREKIEDSTGAIFFLPNVKKRTGLGWEGVKAEVRRLWHSAWGQEWRANEANLAAGLVPDSDP